MNKAEFLDTLRTEHARWDELLSQIDETQMTQPGVVGEWSVKDIVAHVTWFEREMVGMLQARALIGSELWDLSQDERNAVVFEQNRHRPLRDVLAEARQVYEQLLEGLPSLSEEELTDAGRFREMPAEWLPWKIIADNTYEHYRAHAPSIRAWLDKLKR